MYRVLMINPHYNNAMCIQRLVHWEKYNCELYIDMLDTNLTHLLKRVKPDILIISSLLSIRNFESCIKEAIVSNWNIRIIILENEKGEILETEDFHISCILDNMSLSKNLLCEAIETICQELDNQKNKDIHCFDIDNSEFQRSIINKINLKKDLYKYFYIIKGKSNKPLSENRLSNLEEMLKKYTSIDNINYFIYTDIYILISFSDSISRFKRITAVSSLAEEIRVNLESTKLRDIIFYISNEFTAYKVTEELKNFAMMEKYKYFFGSDVPYISFDRIESNSINFTEEECDTLVIKIMNMFITCDRRSINKLLEKLFVDILGKSMNMNLVKHTRESIFFYFDVLTHEIQSIPRLYYNDNRFDNIINEKNYIVNFMLKELDIYELCGINFARNTSAQKKVLEAVNIIYNGFVNVITLEQVAEELGITKEYLSKIFKKVIGLNFNEFVNMVRINYAKRILKTSPNIRKEELARITGFVDGKYFSRVFKRVTGQSPREYLSDINRENDDAEG